MANGALAPAAVDHVTSTVTGAVVGGLGVGAAVLLAPIILPGLGLAALGTTAVAAIGAVPWLGAAVGGYLGYNHAQRKAMRYGIKPTYHP